MNLASLACWQCENIDGFCDAKVRFLINDSKDLDLVQSHRLLSERLQVKTRSQLIMGKND